MLERTKLPYVPFYSFGEPLPVRRDSPTDVGSLGFALSSAAQLIDQRFEAVDELLGSAVPSAPTANALERALDNAPEPLRQRMLNVVTRLVMASEDQIDALYEDFLGDKDAIAQLVSGEICERRRDRTVALIVRASDAPVIRVQRDANPELLAWAYRTIKAANDRFDIVLDKTSLAEGLGLRVDAPELLTPFELDVVELSQHRAERERRQDLRRSTSRTMIELGAICTGLGALVGLALARQQIWAPAAGAALALVVAAALAVPFLAAREARLARGLLTLDTPDSWSRRRCAVELEALGYTTQSRSGVMLFELDDRRRLDLVTRVTSWNAPPSAFDVLLQGRGDAGKLHAEGPAVVLRHLQRSLRTSGPHPGARPST